MLLSSPQYSYGVENLYKMQQSWYPEGSNNLEVTGWDSIRGRWSCVWVQLLLTKEVTILVLRWRPKTSEASDTFAFFLGPG